MTITSTCQRGPVEGRVLRAFFGIRSVGVAAHAAHAVHGPNKPRAAALQSQSAQGPLVCSVVRSLILNMRRVGIPEIDIFLCVA